MGDGVKTKTRKRGNNQVVRVPRRTAETAGLRPRHRLADLAKQITARNRYAEVDLGVSAGREFL